MVIYARRMRMATLGGASCAPTGVPALNPSMGSGVPVVAPAAWLARQHESALRQEMAVSTVPNTIKRDAFAGISPGLQSTSPPV